MIAQIPAHAEITALRDWFTGCADGDYRFVRQFAHDPRPLWWLEFERSRRTPGGRLLSSMSGVNHRAALLSVDVPWEQRLLGVSSRAIRWMGSEADATADLFSLVSEEVRLAARDGVRFLSARIYSDQAHARAALEGNGFSRFDRLIDYVRSTEPSADTPPSSEYRIRLANAEDTSPLVAVARDAFKNHFGRFQADPLMSERVRQTFYPLWVESALGGYADFVFLAEWRGCPIGCSIWRRPTSLAVQVGIPLGHYSLGFVDPAHSGRGVFRALNEAGLARSRAEGALIVEGPTHVDNVPVRKAYEASGWRAVDERQAFHLWLGHEEGRG